MNPETIEIPDVVTGISLSATTIQLITHCIANCPLTEQQRIAVNKELIAAIKEAVASQKTPSRITEPNGLHQVDGQ